MKLLKSHKYLPYFIIGSLLLLGILEAFWLGKLYEDEKRSLQFQVRQELRENVTRSQFTKMQNSNTRLIDSFFEQKGREEDHEKQISMHFKSKHKIEIKDEKGNILDPLDRASRHKPFEGFPPNIRIFLSKDSNENKKPTRKDSMVSVYAYQFQDFIGSLIKPEEIKANLDSTFDGLGLTFDVFRLEKDSLTPKKSDALLVTTHGGDRGLSRQKLTVAVYGFKPLIIKKLYLEIGFAALVFALISLSFWLIYRSLKNQEKLTQLKNDFISNVTHELKTPLTTVGVAIEALSNFDALKNPEQTREYLDISKNELSRLGLLVDNILRMSAFEQKEFELNFEQLDLADLIAQVLDSMRILFERHQANVTFDVPPDVDFMIRGDRTHLTSVVYNLVENALKYGGKNIVAEIATPPSLAVTQAQYNAKSEVIFSIKDDGVGIAEEYQDKVFEKFFRVPTGNVHNTKGYGLGLSYVASVVAKHGGKIELQSAENKGSRFTIRFPKYNT